MFWRSHVVKLNVMFGLSEINVKLAIVLAIIKCNLQA
jgi:hypothetical protein